MVILLEIPRPRPFGELPGHARDELVLAAARSVWRANAGLLALIDTVDRSMSYLDDGHTCTRSWLQAVLNSSRADAQQLLTAVRLCRELPVLGDAVDDGRIGASQLAELGLLRRNPRCRGQLPLSDVLLTDLACSLDFDHFQKACAQWMAMADPDGTHRDHEAAHDRRGVSASIVGTDFQLRAHGGNIDGAAMLEILDHVTDAEFQADWAALVAEHGPNPPAAMLRRTASQRRFDALRKLFEAGAAALLPTPARAPHVDFVIDLATFEATMRRIAGLPVDEPDLDTVLHRHSETGSGVPVDPLEIVYAAIMGRVRRVVVDSAGIVVDAGRTRRLFTKTVAELIRSLQHSCTWPGCGIPSRRSQLDHATPWTQTGGETSTANAGILCDHHNQFKNHGFHTWRDATGGWHTIRPDGTEIAPRTTPRPTPRAEPPP